MKSEWKKDRKAGAVQRNVFRAASSRVKEENLTEDRHTRDCATLPYENGLRPQPPVEMSEIGELFITARVMRTIT
jgi:hypothetical protein